MGFDLFSRNRLWSHFHLIPFNLGHYSFPPFEPNTNESIDTVLYLLLKFENVLQLNEMGVFHMLEFWQKAGNFRRERDTNSSRFPPVILSPGKITVVRRKPEFSGNSFAFEGLNLPVQSGENRLVSRPRGETGWAFQSISGRSEWDKCGGI